MEKASKLHKLSKLDGDDSVAIERSFMHVQTMLHKVAPVVLMLLQNA